MVTITTEVEVNIDEFSDEELVEEMSDRGYIVVECDDEQAFETALQALQRGDKVEAFILLERCIPLFKGLLR